MIQAKDTCLIHNGEIEPDDGITPLRIRKFNEEPLHLSQVTVFRIRLFRL